MEKSERKSDLRDRFATIPLSDLRMGARLRAPIYDPRSERDIMFLNAGAVITSTRLEKLRQRGISHVRVLRSELGNVSRSGGSAHTNAALNLPKAKKHVDNSFAKQIKRHNASYDLRAIKHITTKYQQSVAETRALFENLKTGGDVDGKAVVSSANQSLLQMTDDFDLYVSLGITSKAAGYPHGHSVKSSRLSMAIGTTAGLSEKKLLELGLGCLVHDVGMLRINRALYESEKVLNPVDFLQITKHPSYTFDMIEHIMELPVGSRMVAYQMHERWNGSGYPRHREGRQIHPLASIAAVADVFVAMISDRPHRRAMLPYFAIQEIMFDTNRGMFDPQVVRQLLETLSLFPVGSYVEMSDGRIGKVIRANGKHFCQPIVELWAPQTDGTEFEVVDLAQESGASALYIQRAIPLSESKTSGVEQAKAPQRQLSFYGVGSYVELSDGQIGKVIRVNRRLFTQPVVKLWSAANREGGRIIDLSQESDAGKLKIKRAIPLQELSDFEVEDTTGPLRQLPLF